MPPLRVLEGTIGADLHDELGPYQQHRQSARTAEDAHATRRQLRRPGVLLPYGHGLKERADLSLLRRMQRRRAAGDDQHAAVVEPEDQAVRPGQRAGDGAHDRLGR